MANGHPTLGNDVVTTLNQRNLSAGRSLFLLFLFEPISSLCLMKRPGKSFCIFEKEDFNKLWEFACLVRTSWDKAERCGSSVFCSGHGGSWVEFCNPKLFPFHSCRLVIPSWAKDHLLLSYVLAGQVWWFRESGPPQTELLKCSATRVDFSSLMSEWCWTKHWWIEMLVWPT